MSENKLPYEYEKGIFPDDFSGEEPSVPSEKDVRFEIEWKDMTAAVEAFAHGDESREPDEEEPGEELPRRKRGASSGWGHRGLIAGMAAVFAVVVLAGVFVWGLLFYDRIYPGVRMLGVKGGGLTVTEMSEKIAAAEKELYADGELSIVVGEKKYSIDTGAVEVNVDERAAAEEAAAYGRKGSLPQRAGQILRALFGGCDLPAPEVIFNEAALREQVEKIAEDISSGYADPSWSFEDGVLHLDTGSAGLHLDSEKLYSEAAAGLAAGDFSELTQKAMLEEPDPVDLSAILTELTSEKQNARLDLAADPKGTVILPHSDGVFFDEAEALRRLNERQGRYVDIPASYDPADITKEMLEKNLFRDTLASVSTSLNKNLVGRTTNVRLAAGFINGKILNPGEEFSYNKTVGPRTEARGFKDAKIFQKGEIVDGIGGGICQVSSTLYMAAIRANLKITERRNHQFVVSYTPIGEDATVVYGSTDFRFVNNTPYPVKIETVQSGSTMRAVLYGTKTDDNTVKLSTSVVNKTPYEKIEQSDDTLDYGKRVVETEGHTGYKTVTYRVICDKNGNEISRVKENESTYIKLDEVIRVGTKGQPAVSETNPPTQPVSGETPAAPPTTNPENPPAPPATNPEEPPVTPVTVIPVTNPEEPPAPPEESTEEIPANPVIVSDDQTPTGR